MNTNQAKNIQITDYLNRLGFEPKKVQGQNYWYCSPLRSELTASFKVDNHSNIWYDHGLGKGGNIIDLVMSLHSLSTVSDALSHLDGQFNQTNVSTLARTNAATGYSSFNSNISLSEDKENRQSISILKVVPITNRALIDYLTERKINMDIAKQHCKEIYYSANDNRYFAIGFKNDSGGYKLRNKYFKGCTSKDITTN